MTGFHLGEARGEVGECPAVVLDFQGDHQKTYMAAYYIETYNRVIRDHLVLNKSQ